MKSIERTVCIEEDKGKVDLTPAKLIQSVNQGWKKYGCYIMTTTHKSHICTGQLIGDIHMGATQQLTKTQFSHEWITEYSDTKI